MSRYHIIAAGLVGRRLWPRVKESLSRALALLPSGAAGSLDGLAESLEKAIREAVDGHRQEAERRRRLREMWRQYERNRLELEGER